MSVTWPNKIRYLLNKQGRTLTHVAREAGIRYDTLQRWMRDPPQGAPDISEAIRLAKTMRVTLTELFDDGTALPSKLWIDLETPEAPPVKEVVKAIVKVGGLQRRRQRLSEKEQRRHRGQAG